MGAKLLIAVLVLALSAANSGVASTCAAYCGSSAFFHHPMESPPGSTGSGNLHAHHKSEECGECPPNSGNGLNQRSDCANLVQIEALKEGRFSVDAPSGSARLDTAETPVSVLGLAFDGKRCFVFDASSITRSSASVPLRI